MSTVLSTPLLLALAGAVGLLLGLLLSALFRGESKPSVESTIPEKYQKSGFMEGARLLYSPAAKTTITQLDGDFYEKFNELTLEQKNRVRRLQQLWQMWSGETVPAAAPAVEVKTVVQPPAQELPHVTPILLEEEPAKPVSTKPKTIVEEINDILEEFQAGSSQIKREVHLEDNGHQGVLVWVGSEKFNGVEDVPYPEVKSLLRAAVARWETETEARDRAEAEIHKK